MDYVTGDYLVIKYENYDGLIFLDASPVAAGISIKLNSKTKSYTITSSTTIKILFLPSELNQVSNTIKITGMVNPAAVAPINGQTNFQIVLSLYTS